MPEIVVSGADEKSERYFGERMTPLIREDQLLHELRKLTPARWGEVLDFIGYLRYQTQNKVGISDPKSMTANDLLNSELVGMWADREDIPDSLTFARDLRRSAETQRI